MSTRIFNFAVIFFLLLSCASVKVVSENDDHDHEEDHENESRLDPFHRISDAPVLSVGKLESFTHEFFENLKCDEHAHEHQEDDTHEECEESLCIDVVDLINLVGGNSSEGIAEEQFENASLVLLYLATELDHYCHEHVNTSTLSVEMARSRLLNLTYSASESHRHIHASGIKLLLNLIKDAINHKGHDHEQKEDDHADDNHDEEGHDDEHGQDEHDQDEHDHDEHNSTDFSYLVVKPQCMAPDAILYFMRRDTGDFIDSDMIGQLASIIVYLLSEGSDIENSCRIMLFKTDYINNLYSKFAGGSTSMTLEDLEKLMAELSINPDDHDHGEEEDNHEGHDHRRKRRSVDAVEIHPSSMRRVKREASTDAAFTQCYTAEQFMALYESPKSIDKSAFKEMCPSFLSQKLYGDCSSKKEESSISDAEKYGYSSLSVFIICLCSIFGVVLIPCTSRKVYSVIMSTFLGLAVGTLFADAILHLIPRVFGVHAHEEGHDHGSEVVVEDFVRFGLVIIAALYLFYLLELALPRCGGHSHGDENLSDNAANDHNHGNNIVMGTLKGVDEEHGKNQDQESKEKYSTTSSLESSNGGCLGLSPVAFMIVIGDAIHNTADGLAIGASFSNGVSTGIATSIAVFCHELPHELGDFAVLLQSGCSFGKALFLNLLSSLTAFIGLYIGLSISTDTTTEKWIFAIAAGMFIYISLVDLLPQLVKGKGSDIFFHNVGLLSGFLIMFILVIYEEHIEV